MEHLSRNDLYCAVKKLSLIERVRVSGVQSVLQRNSNPLGYNCTFVSSNDIRENLNKSCGVGYELPEGVSQDELFDEYLKIVKDSKRRSAILE